MSQVSGVIAQPTPYVSRSRIYAFVVDETGHADRARLRPLREGLPRRGALGRVEDRRCAGRSRSSACSAACRDEDQMRFQMEKEILERVQGHPNIVELLALGRRRQRRVHPAGDPRQGRERLHDPRAARHDARGAPEGRAPEAPPRRPARGAAARAHLPRARVHHPGRDRGRVRAPRARHLPPRHQAGEHPRQAARSEPARLADEDQARRLQRRQGRRPGPRRLDDAVPGGPRHALLPEPRAGDQHVRAPRQLHAGLARGRVLRGLLHRHLENDTFSLFNRNEHVLDRRRRSRAQEASCSTGRSPSRARPTCAAASSRASVAPPTSTRSARCSTT